MRELGIPFSVELIPPIMADLKTVTRRIMNPQPPAWITEMGFTAFTPPRSISGRGRYEGELAEKFFKLRHCHGDHLWVRECHGIIPQWYEFPELLPEPRTLIDGNWVFYRSDFDKQTVQPKWRSGRFMPRKYARTWLEVLSVRAERLQEITAEDVFNEGIKIPVGKDGSAMICLSGKPRPHEFLDRPFKKWTDADAIRHWFAITWDRLHGRDEHGWDTNPWVVRYEFRRLAR